MTTSSASASFGIDVIAEETLAMSVYELMKLRSTKDVETILLQQLYQLDNHKLSMPQYVQWMRKVDKWCDNLTNICDVFRTVQMTVTKQRVNTGDSILEIDG